MNHKLPRFYALPYAGGSSRSYRSIRERLEGAYDMPLIELPGRGFQADAEPLRDLDLMTEVLGNQIMQHGSSPYVLFGHSMGANLAYLLCHYFKEHSYMPPFQVVLGARRAPQITAPEIKRSRLSKEELFGQVSQLGNFADVMQNPEFQNYIEPIIRADFAAVENYQHEIREKLNVPCAILTGTRDSIRKEDVAPWQDLFKEPVEFYEFDGDHFFVYEYPDVIAGTLLALAA